MISGTESTVRETRSLSLTKLRYRLTVWCDHVTCGMSKSRGQNLGLGLGLEAKILAWPRSQDLASVSKFRRLTVWYSSPPCRSEGHEVNRRLTVWYGSQETANSAAMTQSMRATRRRAAMMRSSVQLGGGAATSRVLSRYDTIRYDTRCYSNMRLKADMSQLNVPHGTDN